MGNCVLSAVGHGQRTVSVPTFEYGIGIIPNGEAQTRNGRVFYTKVATSDSFSMEVQFTSYASFKSFCDWLEDYSRAIASSSNTTVRAMHVELPARGVNRWGIPTRGIVRGDKVGDFVYRLSLSFEGTRRIIEASNGNPGITRFLNPALSDSVNYRLSPVGIQLEAGQSAEDTLYGISESDLNSLIGRTGLTRGQIGRMV